MPLTPETLTRHELIGLPVRVVEASNQDLVGIAGEVTMETTRTLSISGEAAGGVSRVWQVPKADATFAFTIEDGAAGSDPTRVLVEGDRLVARPARRTERRGDSKWR